MTSRPDDPALDRRRAGLTLLGAAVLMLVVALTRALVFPASVWEQDEAYFAAAVVEIDLDSSQPHAPFFPLWIGLGKLAHIVGAGPAEGLQVLSAVFSTLLLIPLWTLWKRPLGPVLSVAAALLASMLPGTWLFSARAFSGTAATALLIVCLALWSRDDAVQAVVIGGSLAAGLAVLIRPQFALVVVVVMAVVLTRRGWARWPEIVLGAAATMSVGFGVFVFAAGGPSVVLAALDRHLRGHFGALPSASRNPLESGIADALVHPAVIFIWVCLTILGFWSLWRSPGHRREVVPVAAAVIAVLVLTFGLSNPAHPRYAVPVLLLSSGLVAAGLRAVIGTRWTVVSIAASLVVSVSLVLPAAAELRCVPSPPVRALARADDLARERAAVVVADRTLHAFVRYLSVAGELGAPVLFDHLFETGFEPPPLEESVMVFDLGHEGRLIENHTVEDFGYESVLLRRLSQDRFLEVRVVDGAAILARDERAKDLVTTLTEHRRRRAQ